MLLELLLLGLIVFVIGPIVYVGFMDVCYVFWLLTILAAGLERVLNVYRPTPVTKPPLYQTRDRKTFKGCGRKDSFGPLHSRA